MSVLTFFWNMGAPPSAMLLHVGIILRIGITIFNGQVSLSG
jgi:hypothetical protein